MNDKPRVLLSGDVEHGDFGEVRCWLDDRANLVGVEAAVDLVVLCQSRPGQFAQDYVESLYRRFPLARFLAVLGSWCEGEQRSGRPWHGVERVYWYNAIGRLTGLLSGRNTPAPRTQTATERIEQHARHWPLATADATAVIVAARRSDYEPLADMCRVLGISVAEFVRIPTPADGVSRTSTTANLIFLSGDDLPTLGGVDSIAALRKCHPLARIVALVNFPRATDIAALRQAGCNAVLGKPILLAELIA